MERVARTIIIKSGGSKFQNVTVNYLGYADDNDTVIDVIEKEVQLSISKQQQKGRTHN